MDLLTRAGNTLFFLAGALLFTAAVPITLRTWLARQRWVRVNATVTAIDSQGQLTCAVPSPTGPRPVQMAPFGEGSATVGDTVVLHHPPGRPEAATHGSAFGSLVAAGLSGVLALVCWASVFGVL